MKQAFVLAAALALLGASSAAQAGQFKNVNINSIPNAGCVTVHSSPQNQGNSGGASMATETFEFIPPTADSYRCCVGANTTNRGLFVRLMGLNGAALASFQTPVNGGGCTAYAVVAMPFAFQCTVSAGAGLPVVANAHYTLQICRQ
jgi:hypothetical protein